MNQNASPKPDPHRLLARQEGVVAALLGLVMSLLKSMPPKQRQAALERFESESEHLTATMLAYPDQQADWGLEGAEMVRSSIAETFPKT